MSGETVQDTEQDSPHTHAIAAAGGTYLWHLVLNAHLGLHFLHFFFGLWVLGNNTF